MNFTQQWVELCSSWNYFSDVKKTIGVNKSEHVSDIRHIHNASLLNRKLGFTERHRVWFPNVTQVIHMDRLGDLQDFKHNDLKKDYPLLEADHRVRTFIIEIS
jgi:hypothetical protein